MKVILKQKKGFLPFLLLTAVLCGGLVMVIEVLGSRVIGPFFGVSLFVWTSLITVTLIALAIGYALGGVISDKYPEPRYLYIIISSSAVFVLLVPLLKSPVLKFCVIFGLKGGAFASTLILFGPSLLLLGCVTPYLVKIAAKELNNIGRMVGGLYALSTVGSTIGTVVTGFFLIAYLGVDKIFIVVGLLLLGLSFCYFLIFERRWSFLVLLLIPSLSSSYLLMQSNENKYFVAKDGTKIETIHKQTSYYGEIKVVDYKFGNRHTRELMIDGQIQGGIDMTNGLSIYDFSYFQQFIPNMLRPNGENCLIIGLGMGIILRWYEEQGIACDVVDIDPAIIEINKKYFNLKVSGHTEAQDARYFLANSTLKYDYIIMDVFNGDMTPAHLLSLEAVTLLKQRLAYNGILSINLIGSIMEDTYMTASIIKTLEQVFKQVEIFPAMDINASLGLGNLAVMAYQGPLRVLSTPMDIDLSIHPKIEARVRQRIKQRFWFSEDTRAIILTDDYNPIDYFDGGLREKIRLRMIQSTHWDLLIS